MLIEGYNQAGILKKVRVLDIRKCGGRRAREEEKNICISKR
jgi:hypothetical protein